jgi:hypothetical protein
LKAGDGKASEEQTAVNHQRARRGTTASKTAVVLAAAAASAKHKTIPKKNISTPFQDNTAAAPGDDSPVPVANMTEVVNKHPV